MKIDNNKENWSEGVLKCILSTIPHTDDNNQLVFGQNVLLLFKNGLHYDGLRWL